MKNRIEKPRVNGSAYMWVLSLVILLSLMTSAVTNAQGGKTSFAGTWTLNTDKSTMPQGGQGGGGMRMGGGNFVASQDANLLTVERTRTGQDGQSTVITMKYTLDGKESKNTSPRGNSISVAKWSPDGKALTIETSRTMDMNGESRTMKSTEVWTLTDEKTLKVESSRQGQNGDVKAVLVYDKK